MNAPKSISLRIHAHTRVLEDVDAAAAALSEGLQGEFVQTESSSFRGRWITMRTPRLVAQFAIQESAVFRRIRVPEDRFAFIVPLAVGDLARWDGAAVHPDDIIVCPPGAECLAFDPPATRFAIVTAKLGGQLVRVARRILNSDASGAVTVRCGAAAAELRERLSQASTAIESGRLQLLSASVLDFGALIRVCLERARDVGRALYGTRNHIVRRAEAFFRSHVGEGVSVAQLSSVAGVSERSLRNAFYDVYTTSPKRYMKLWQLHQVRRALRRGDACTATVTDVATCYGFYELGRFAGAYKSLFGEVPSETLNKARNRERVAADA
jgi:AraC family ethanolamine operon transcriptional activator